MHIKLVLRASIGMSRNEKHLSSKEKRQQHPEP
jgi:hypothetical protein